MSGRNPQSESALPPDPARRGSPSEKLRILLPIILSLVLLAALLILFWPDSEKGKKGQGRRGQGAVSSESRSPVGGSSDADLEDLGNSSATGKRGGGSPVGGGPVSRPASNGENWWYEDEKKPAKGKDGDEWWH
ncbi:MAG: hypothetical protein M3Y08_03390 [Fibrobacterota bacterium]|nr:hypothetical protein [Fibrobacterota bacterium]